MSNENVFETPKDAPSVVEENATSSFLERLVGPGKKFATVEDLAKGKWESDEVFVPQLQREAAEARAELTTRLSIEDLLDKRMPVSNPTTNTNVQTNQTVTEENKNAGLSLTDIQRVVLDVLNQEQTKNTKAQNVAIVQSELQKAWGSNFPVVLKAKAKELGLGEDFLNEVAGKSPKAFLQLVGGEKTVPAGMNQVPPKGMGTTNQATNKRTAEYYRNLKKQDKKLYWSPAIQRQMFEDMKALGSDF